MKTMRIAVLIIAATLAATSIAEAGLGSTVKGVGRALGITPSATVGTVMAFAPVSSDSRQTAVLILDTVVQMSMGCYVVPAADQRRFHRKVEVGSTFEAVSFTQDSVDIGEMECTVVGHWESSKRGNKARREFLTGSRGFLGPIMAYAMRGRPNTARHFFPDGAVFAGVVSQLPGVVQTLSEFGFDLSEVRDAIFDSSNSDHPPAAAMSSHGLGLDNASLHACRAALRGARSAFTSLVPVAESIAAGDGGIGHHGEQVPIMHATEAAASIDNYFETFPPESLDR